MMSPDEITILIKEGEGLTVEFKGHFSSRIDEDMVAFANTKGGVILLGVRDDKTISGERLTNDLKARINSLARNCQPPISITIKQIQEIVVVDVPQGEEKPYSCRTGYFRRLDGTTQKMTNSELRIMFQENELIPFEDKIVRDMTWDDISKRKIKDFLREANIDVKKANARDFLTSLNVAKGNEITNAGALFFAEDISRFVPQTRMTLIAFKGTNRVHIFDRQDIQDDLLTQFHGAEFFLKKHLNRRSVIAGMNREDIYELPLEALREAITNSIIHRDYSMRGTSLMVEVYEDRVEIVNPGGLPKGLNKKDLGRISVRRNEHIADLFFRLDKGERAGTGIKRMNEAMAAAGLTLPEIEYETFFRISFTRPFLKKEIREIKNKLGEKVGDRVGEKVGDRVGEKLTENQKKIIENILHTPKISARELSGIVGISQRKIEQNISRLKNSGLLNRVGSAKGGYWEVIGKG